MNGHQYGLIVACWAAMGCAAGTEGRKDAGAESAEDASQADAGLPRAPIPPSPRVDGGPTMDAATPDAARHPGGEQVEDAAARQQDAGAPPLELDAGSAWGRDAGSDGGEETREEFCSGRGPVIRVPVETAPGGDICTGTVARKLFKNALCTCESTRFAGYLNTGSFSSADSESGVVKAGGAVGVNEHLIAGAYLDVGGTLRVHGDTVSGGYTNVAGDLELNGFVTLPGFLTVARDARFGSDALVASGAVTRDLYTRPGKAVPPPWVFAGSRIEADFTLEKPCACEPKDLLDVDAIVQDAQLRNDNAHPAVNLDPGALKGLVGAAQITLPCGRFYLDEVSGVGDVRLLVNGRTALFIGGDLATTGRFDIDLGPDGEIDIFIAGNLMQIGYGTFGDVNRPAAVRAYVGGDGDILYLGYQPFGGNLYAPRSRMLSDGFVDVKGSLFVRELNAGAYIKVVYDREILEQGNDQACEPPPQPPASGPDAGPPPVPPECSDACDEACGGTKTCVDNQCSGCRTDADCCAPLVCYPDGRCGALLL